MSCLEISAWSSVLLGQTCSGTWATLGISACSWWCWNVLKAGIHHFPLRATSQFYVSVLSSGFFDLGPFYPVYAHLFCHLKCIFSSLLFTAFRFCRMLSFLIQITAKPCKIHNLSCMYIKIFSPVLSFLLTHFSNSSMSVWHRYARTSNTVPPVLCAAGSSPPQKIMLLPLCVAPKSYSSVPI